MFIIGCSEGNQANSKKVKKHYDIVKVVNGFILGESVETVTQRKRGNLNENIPFPDVYPYLNSYTTYNTSPKPNEEWWIVSQVYLHFRHQHYLLLPFQV